MRVMPGQRPAGTLERTGQALVRSRPAEVSDPVHSPPPSPLHGGAAAAFSVAALAVEDPERLMDLRAGARAGSATARLALRPARAASHATAAGRAVSAAARGLERRGAAARGKAVRRLDEAVEEVAAPAIARAVDRALAGPLVEAVAGSLARHRVVERAVAAALSDPQVRARAQAALEEDRVADITRRVVASPPVERAVAEVASSPLAGVVGQRIVSSPQLRAALAHETAGLARETTAAVRVRAERLDDRVERRAERAAGPDGGAYGGAVTRALALCVDVAAVQLCLLAAAGLVALVASLTGGVGPTWLLAGALGGAVTIAAAGYFALFWSTTGQTPGMRAMGLRVVDARGAPVSMPRALVRFVGLVLAIVPLFAGFVPVLFDRRRRGLHDLLAGTVVERV
jgi:uncharacterized RDD family membrane protein YckC